MKTIKYKSSLAAAAMVFGGLFVFVGFMTGPVGMVNAQAVGTPCYYGQTGSGQNIYGTMNQYGACIPNTTSTTPPSSTANSPITIAGYYNGLGYPSSPLIGPITTTVSGLSTYNNNPINPNVKGYPLGGGLYSYSLNISSSDTVTVNCYPSATNYLNLGGLGSSNSFTGPGTFYPVITSCGNNYVGAVVFQLTTPPTPITVSPVLYQISPAQISYGTTFAPTLIFTGSNFSATGNTVQFSGGSSPMTVNNVSSTNSGTTISITAPNLSAGTYNVSVNSPTATASSNWSNTLSFTVTAPQQPTNLTSTMVLNDTQQGVQLNWTNNDPKQTGVSIEQSTDGGTTFSAIDSVAGDATSYFVDLNDSALDSSNEIYRVRSEYPCTMSTNSNNSNTASVINSTQPCTTPSPNPSNTVINKNCVLIGGNGPKKIIFRKGDVWVFSQKGLLAAAKDIMTNGFQKIEPFATSFSQFSFYVDLKRVMESNLPRAGDTSGSIFFTQAGEDTILSSSSCGNDAFESIFFSGLMINKSRDAQLLGQTSLNGYPLVFLLPKTSFITNPPLDSAGDPLATLAKTAIHESGHAIGRLDDEYIYTGVPTDFPTQLTHLTLTNCTQNPSISYRSSIDNHMYGASNEGTGCSFTQDSKNNDFYRPSDGSLMNSGYGSNQGGDRFNVISCGYVFAGINGELNIDMSADEMKAQAEKYWPMCLTMAKVGTVYAYGIPAVSPTPQVTTISTTNLSAGDPTITGSNFSTSTTNIIHLVNTASSTLVYDIIAPSSSNGTTLSFLMPTGASSITLGTYTLQVGAFNSSWSPPITIHVIASFTASCTVSPASLVRGPNAYTTWTSSVSGGPSGAYSYAWSWPNGAGTTWAPYGGNTSSLSNIGPFTTGYSPSARVMKLTVTSGSATATTSCNALDLLPATPVLSISSTSPTSVSLSWTDADINGYFSFNILYSTTTIATISSSTRAYTVTNLTPSTTYCYVLQAAIDAQNSANSTSVCAKTGVASPAPVVTPPSTTFTVGQSIQVYNSGSAGLSVRSSPLATAGTVSGSPIANAATGTITVAPSGTMNGTYSGGNYWWYIKYSNGVTGWSSETYLQAYTTPVVPVTYTITPSASVGGTISPGSTVMINSGSSQTFTITPNSGYQIGSVTVDGSNVGGVTSYTFSNIAANHTISVSFTAIPVPINNAPPPSYAPRAPATSLTPASMVPTIPSRTPTPTPAAPLIVPQTTTVNATVTYSCPTGSVLDSSGNTCTNTSTTPVTASYSCPSGYNLNSSNTCSSVPSAPAAGATSPSPLGPGAPAAVPFAPQPMVVNATATYSCPTGSTLDSSGTNCTTTSSVSATANYSCPSGYTLNSANNTCTGPVSLGNGAIYSANVWNSIINWFQGFFK